MSDAPGPARRLPARPSLEQLRKQARERLGELRTADPSVQLADAQFQLARDYGFESWPRLVHHAERVLATARLAEFERLADDILAGYRGDDDALRRLIVHFGVAYSPEQFLPRVRGRVDDFRGDAAGDPSLDDVRGLVANQYGFASWSELAQALAQAPAHGVPALHSAVPPFYRIDDERGMLEVLPPLATADWDEIARVMIARGLTGLRTHAMTDDAMARLGELEFVTTVHASGSALTDDGVLQLARLPHLEELELGGNVTDRGLAVLRQLPQLRRFAAAWAPGVTDAGMRHLAACERIEAVNLMGTRTGDGTLATLRGKPSLRHLHIGRLTTDAGLAHLHQMPVFARWQGGEPRYDLMAFAPEPNHLMLDGAISDRGLASLAGLDGLFGLGFFMHARAFTAAGIASLAALPRLGFLNVPGHRCDDDAFRAIAGLPALRFLLAQGPEATDDGFVALSRSRTLEFLWGRECPNLHGRGFAALQELPNLVGLGVSCRHVDDAALAALPRFPSLRQLMPMDVSDDGFRHVGACARLEKLWCMYCRDTGDAATGHVASLHLTTYYAGKTRITDRSLETLSRMSSLGALEFWECARITDEGIAALASLPSLRRLHVSGSPRVTRDVLARFPATVRVRHES